jgi:hypothetical protein
MKIWGEGVVCRLILRAIIIVKIMCEITEQLMNITGCFDFLKQNVYDI